MLKCLFSFPIGHLLFKKYRTFQKDQVKVTTGFYSFFQEDIFKLRDALWQWIGNERFHPHQMSFVLSSFLFVINRNGLLLPHTYGSCWLSWSLCRRSPEGGHAWVHIPSCYYSGENNWSFLATDAFRIIWCLSHSGCHSCPLKCHLLFSDIFKYSLLCAIYLKIFQ